MKKNFKNGDRVVRDPDGWGYSDESGQDIDYDGVQNVGTVIDVRNDGWFSVRWDYGARNAYEEKDIMFAAEKSKPTKKPLREFPHVCPSCRGPAFIGFMSVDCSKKCS